MFGFKCVVDLPDEYYTLEDYNSSNIPRWCVGCGDHAIFTAVQKLCRDEQLPPEKLVFVSGIGCSSRFPHYINAYGFHGLHGRALPVAEGIKIRRPDLHVFVSTGDGDCCSIGASHWIHAVRYNMNMVVMVHNNHIYGLTKMQVSPTSPRGLITNTTPYGAYLEPLNPVATTLGITNVSFVAQVVEWMPDLLYSVLKEGFHHKGLSFIHIFQRCPAYLPKFYEDLVTNPDGLLLLRHPKGIQLDESVVRIFKNQEEHDPTDLIAAQKMALRNDKIPVGILYRNENVPCYEDIRRSPKVTTKKLIEEELNKILDKFAV